MNRKGSTSIFILIVLSAIIGFAVIMINNVHHVSFVNIARDNLYLSIDSKFMDYDDHIYSNYGLSSVRKDGLEETIEENFKENVSSINNIHGLDDLKITLNSTRSLDDNWSLSNQIGRYMEYRLLVDISDRFLLMKNKENRINEEFDENNSELESLSDYVKEIDKLISDNNAINDLVEKYNDSLDDVDFEELEDNLDDFNSLQSMSDKLSRSKFRKAIRREGGSLEDYYDEYMYFVDFLEEGRGYTEEIKSKIEDINDKLKKIEKETKKILSKDSSSGYLDSLKNNCIGVIRYSDYFHGNGNNPNKIFLEYINEQITDTIDENEELFSKLDGDYSDNKFPDDFKYDLDLIRKFSELKKLEKRSIDRSLKDKLMKFLKVELKLENTNNIKLDSQVLECLPSKKAEKSKEKMPYVYPNKIVNRRYEEILKIQQEKANATVGSFKDMVLENKNDDYKSLDYIDNLRLTEYIIQTFQDRSENDDYNYFDKYERKSYYTSSEIEYILIGDYESKNNINRTKYLIMIARTPLNAYHIYNDPLKYGICNEIGLAIGSIWGGGPFVTHGLVVSWASWESFEDYKTMIEGESVPLVKDKKTWKTDFISKSSGEKGQNSGEYDQFVEIIMDMAMVDYIMEDTAQEYINESLDDEKTKKLLIDSYKNIRSAKNEEDIQEKIKKSKASLYKELKNKKVKLKKLKKLDIDLYYQDYLRLLMMVQPLDIKIQRTKDIIYLNLYKEYGEIISLEDYVTEVDLNLHTKHRSMFMDKGRNIDINVIRGY
jgi:DNA-binding phage protein